MATETFPAGGSRQAVYQFMRDHGFVMSAHSDKQWHRNGLEAHIYGAGSMARVFTKLGAQLTDKPLEAAIADADQYANDSAA
jgi:hypothetical protein